MLSMTFALCFQTFPFFQQTLLSNGARTSLAIRDSLARVRDFEGASGLTTFDEKGEVQKPMKFMTIKNSKFVEYQK